MAFRISDKCTGCTACQTLCPADAVFGTKKSLHAIDPEACILCGACGRICPAGAVTDHFGLVVARVPRKDWERPVFNLKICMSCGICQESCPSGVIAMALQQVGSRHLFPFLENAKGCIGCGFCAQDCPVEAIALVTGKKEETEDASLGGETVA